MATVISRSTAYRMIRREGAFVENYSETGERLMDSRSLKICEFQGTDGYVRLTNPTRQKFYAVK